MDVKEVLAQLESHGTAQNRKVYSRHGVGGPLFGVSYANLGRLRKEIGLDAGLALELWASGNHDARVLATMISDPGTCKASVIDRWIRDVDNYVLADALANLVGRSPHARSRMEKWIPSKKEWVGACGWNLMVGLAASGPDLGDDYFLPYLAEIEQRIHSSANRIRHSMNMALIQIGARNPRLQKAAIAAAKRIGKVEVDHGETGCKTPDAIPYIRKMAERAARGQAGTKKAATGRQARS